jgi:hypothetical protein
MAMARRTVSTRPRRRLLHQRPRPALVPPELPPELTQKYVLGSLCARGHAWNDTGQSLRRKSNGGCAACFRLSETKRHRNGAQTPARTPAPQLPGYLREAGASLSQDLCAVWTHRYKQSGYTLRYRDDGSCVQCTTARALDKVSTRPPKETNNASRESPGTLDR